MHWASEFIGKPWVSGARGPDVFDCWGLLFHIYKTKYQTILPLYEDTNAANVLEATKQINAGCLGSDWERIEKPFEGCAVGMSTHKLFHHVGLYIVANGGVILHCADGKGVVAQSIPVLKSQGWGRIEFFKHNGARY